MLKNALSGSNSSAGLTAIEIKGSAGLKSIFSIAVTNSTSSPEATLYPKLKRDVDRLAVDSGYREPERERFSLDGTHTRLVNLPEQVTDGVLCEKGGAGVVDDVDVTPEFSDCCGVLDALCDDVDSVWGVGGSPRGRLPR